MVFFYCHIQAINLVFWYFRIFDEHLPVSRFFAASAWVLSVLVAETCLAKEDLIGYW